MTSSLPEYPLTDLSGSYINQLGQFEDILEEANKKGLINNPPSDEEETYNFESQRIRIQTIASRLWLLGYLRRKISAKNIRKRIGDIKDAVAQFQKDASLKQDNWVGNKTWYALDQLVSFESGIIYDQWFTNNSIRPEVIVAVKRATQLRLWSLGLYKSKPNKNFKDLKLKDLKNLESVLKIFLIKHNLSKVDFNYETLKILFDQDMLINSIAKRSSNNEVSFLLNLPTRDNLKQKELAQKFIVNCTKVELWLLGYEVKIDGKNDFQMIRGSNLYKAISHYYNHFLNYNASKATELAEKITPKLIKGIAVVNDVEDDNISDDAVEEIAKEISSDEDVNKAWSYLKNKGMRLWDGLTRVWRWFKKIGKKVVKFIRENVFKAFFRYASKAFKIVKRGMTALVKSIDSYLKGEINVTNISFRFSKDMDTTILMSEDLSYEHAELGISKLISQSKTFNLACRIVGWIFDVFINLTTGFMGWARLLVSLLRSFKELKLLYIDFKAIATT